MPRGRGTGCSRIAVVIVVVALGAAACTSGTPGRTVPTTGAVVSRGRSVPTPSATTPPSEVGAGGTSSPAGSSTAGAGGGAPAGIPVPDPALTPGAVFAGVTVAQICTPGYATSVRSVSASEKRQVYAEYGVVDVAGAHEVDHLISLELGGSNAITNLWPEPYAGPYGAHAKDAVENYLHAQVCAGRIALADAQRGIATRWWTYLAAAGGATVAPAPTADPAPSSAPAPAPPAPAGTPAPSGVVITGPPAAVAPGGTETLTAHTGSAALCALAVALPSGAQSESQGLGAATADATGVVTWTWIIGTRTAPGTAIATVTCPAGSVSATFPIG